MVVRTTQDILNKDGTIDIPKGSGIHVERTTFFSYIGLWSCSCGTLKVKVKKKYCKVHKD